MQSNNNLSCIPFYHSLEEQDYRKWYAYGDKYPHKVPNDYLVPFYFVTPPYSMTDLWEIDEVVFYRSCGDCEEPILGDGSFNLSFSEAFDRGDSDMESHMRCMLDNQLVIPYMTDEFGLVIYYAEHTANLNLPRGLYYIKIVLKNSNGDTDTYYSDIFFAETRENLAKEAVRIEWWNEGNVEYNGGMIPYALEWEGNYYKSEIYLDTEIGKPDYNFTEEGEERNGYFFPTKQISEKSYNMGFIAPEYLCDAMRLIRMADVVKITDRLGRLYKVEQFEMDVNWTEHGHYAEVGCSFQTDTIVKKVGKAYTNISDR